MVLVRFIVSILSLIIWNELQAAGPVCLNYEIYEHQNLVPAAPPNRALANYNHALIIIRNLAIPALAPAAFQLGVSKIRVLGAMPTAWQNGLIALGVALNYQEACLMAQERQNIGIDVRFQHPNEIAAIAAGFGIPAVAAAFGWTVPNLTRYLNRSLGGGGYRSTLLATALYRLRHNPPPNFINLLAGGSADTIMIHIHEPRRVSKNAKELSYNSILNTPGYFSLKDEIDGQFNFLLLPVPDSGTILVADQLQLN
ncbi:MAG: hypothetical protein K0M45_06855 [Candidatus Paracaedibacteraceae bacterium]|nr:hypothetical protein [Candidatus Paracaedibacteraceae bacterium]